MMTSITMTLFIIVTCVGGAAVVHSGILELKQNRKGIFGIAVQHVLVPKLSDKGFPAKRWLWWNMKAAQVEDSIFEEGRVGWCRRQNLSRMEKALTWELFSTEYQTLRVVRVDIFVGKRVTGGDERFVTYRGINHIIKYVKGNGEGIEISKGRKQE